MIFAMVLIVLGVLALIGYPLARGRVRREVVLDDAEDDVKELIRRKESSYAAIKELEFDYRTGKLSEEDYRNLYNIYKAEALRAIQALEEGESTEKELLEAEVEEEIRRKRRKLPQTLERKDASSGIFCPACGAENEGESVFCTVCGSQLGKACRACGTLNSSNARFCYNCGERLPARAQHTSGGNACPQCGYECGVGARFCSQCGAALAVAGGTER